MEAELTWMHAIAAIDPDEPIVGTVRRRCGRNPSESWVYVSLRECHYIRMLINYMEISPRYI